MLETVTHSLAPVIDAESRILLLGTMPSPKSRETGFYYGHPQNQFWNVLAAVFDTGTPQSIPEKLAFLHAHHIALWDVLHSCEIKGAEDSSIQNPVVHDIRSLLSKAPDPPDFHHREKGYRSVYEILFSRHAAGVHLSSLHKCGQSRPLSFYSIGNRIFHSPHLSDRRYPLKS